MLGQALDVEAASTSSLFANALGISSVVSEHVRGRERVHGRAASCSDGCSACCEHLVPISTVEAVHLARVLEALPEAKRVSIRRRFVDAVARLRKAGLLEPSRVSALRAPPAREGESLWDATSRRYRELAIACPFLEARSCTIYGERPMVCREYAVTSPPRHCAHPRSEGVVPLPRPVRMSEVLADTMRALTPDEGQENATSIPLVLTLQWVEKHGAEVDAALARAGTSAAQTLLDMIEVEED